MKLDFLQYLSGASAQLWRVAGETRCLTDVLLSAPSHLEAVPCCSVTRESLAGGFEPDIGAAQAEHDELRSTLEALGVRCHLMPAAPGLPDLCFTRDSVVTTPWGPVIMKPALAHRRSEVAHAERYLRSIGAAPLLEISNGSIEGGDVCIAREGLLILGQSGERTTACGVAALAALFERHAWEVLVCPFDPRHLHLDTIFCMLDERTALAHVQALDPSFVKAVIRRGITLLPVTERESRDLGCNILSLDGRTILMRAGQDRIARSLAGAGFNPVAIGVSQFAACGGGIHCLTMPLARH